MFNQEDALDKTKQHLVNGEMVWKKLIGTPGGPEQDEGHRSASGYSLKG